MAGGVSLRAMACRDSVFGNASFRLGTVESILCSAYACTIIPLFCNIPGRHRVSELEQHVADMFLREHMFLNVSVMDRRSETFSDRDQTILSSAAHLSLLG